MSSSNQGHPQAHEGIGVSQNLDMIDADYEDAVYDPDDGYTEETMTNASMSITSSIRGHTFEDGIRYHKFKDGQYFLPNDENEQNREDMKHAMTLMICGSRLYFAPIGENPQKIIDLGTGTGIWAIEMADAFPSAEVTGIDLSPIQPEWVPPNVRFVVDDVEDEWLYPPSHFDYIHTRHTIFGIRHPKTLMERSFQHVKPGGWVEFQELLYYPQCDDGSMSETYALRRFLEFLREGVAKLGSDLHGVTKLRSQMIDAGFVNVREVQLKLPVGTWAREKNLKMPGLFLATAILDGLVGLARRPLEKGLGWSLTEIEVILAEVRSSLADRSQHTYMPMYMVYGQRPLDTANEQK